MFMDLDIFYFNYKIWSKIVYDEMKVGYVNVIYDQGICVFVFQFFVGEMGKYKFFCFVDMWCDGYCIESKVVEMK